MADALVAIYVIAAPAMYFPLWGEVLAYVFEGVIVLGALGAYLTRRRSAQRHAVPPN